MRRGQWTATDPMPDDRTTVTELGTALGTLPFPDAAAALAARPRQLRVADEVWDHLDSIAAVGPVRHRAGLGVRQRPGPARGPRRAAGPDAPDHRVDRRPPAPG